jgi:hypothetical protein
MSLNRTHDDECYVQYQEAVSSGHNDYIMNRAAVMRGNHCQPGGPGRVCSTYGPFDNSTYGRQVTRDSYLSGRGQALSNCPDCQVRFLPDDLFQPLEMAPTPGEHTPLPMEVNRVSKACEPVSDVDVTAYFMMPTSYQDDFRGVAVQSFGLDTKTHDRLTDLPSGTADRDAQMGVTSYGFYPTCQ